MTPFVEQQTSSCHENARLINRESRRICEVLSMWGFRLTSTQLVWLRLFPHLKEHLGKQRSRMDTEAKQAIDAWLRKLYAVVQRRNRKIVFMLQ